MMKSATTQDTLTSAMVFAWDVIAAGERIVAFAGRWGADEAYDLRVGYTEIWIHNRGKTVTGMGERLERLVNWLGMKLGYEDGAVSGWVVDRDMRPSTAVIAEPMSA